MNCSTWGGLHFWILVNGVNDQGPEKWTDLYAILAGEGRHVSKVEGDGHCLLPWRRPSGETMIFHILLKKSYKMLHMSW